MDSYWPHDHPPGANGSPTRRKMRSKSGAGGKVKDPILELMMCDLMQRQSTSNSGAVLSSSGTKHLPVSQIVAHQSYSAGADPLGPSASAAGSRGCCCRLWQKLWFKILIAAVLLAAVAVAIAVPVAMSRRAVRRGMLPPQHGLGPRLNTSGMALVFADDFTQFDAETWNYDIGDGQDYGLNSWGNYELQCYTTSANNIDVIPHPEYPEDDGVLRIRPVYSDTPLTCANRKAPSSKRQWTSAKIDTKNKIAFSWAGQQVFRGPFTGRAPAPGTTSGTLPTTSGSGSSSTAGTTGRKRALLADASAGNRSAGTDSSSGSCGRVVVESRMKLPVAAGRWSALWMMPMPQPCPTGSPAAECGFFGSWPKSGEIDIVEQVNKDAEVLGTIHFATQVGGWHQYLDGKLPLSEAALLDWNIYQLVWNCTSLTWYVNSEQIYQVTKPMLGTSPWPFDEPFFLILNTAIGGLLTGNVAPDTAQSRPFMVDYVRVYAAPGAVPA